MKTIKHNPYDIVKMFEEEVAQYTGAPFAVAVDSCTNALFLCCKYHKVIEVTIPRKTYLSVPMSIIHAGGEVVFEDKEWSGAYQLKPYPIYDAAKRLTSRMYTPGTAMCLSFHIKKTLAIGKGGMILTDDYKMVEWLKKARYEGRSEVNYKDDNIDMLGWNMYMTPEQASRGILLFEDVEATNEDTGGSWAYKDLSGYKIFKR